MGVKGVAMVCPVHCSIKKHILSSLLLLVISIPTFSPAADISIKTSRTIDTLSNDTLNVKLRFFAQGRYDTLWKIDTSFDTSRVPVDIVLSIDLSGSMDTATGFGHSRIIFAKVAALGFLDSLKTGDRVAILGWTRSNTGIGLSDSSKTSLFYQKWSGFLSDFNLARSFIRDSIFLEGASRTTDTCDGQTLVAHNIITSGQFGNTPMHIASVMAMSRLSALGRPQTKKVAIMLSDGENNDGVPHSTVTTFLDSLWRTQSLQFNTIGFMQGDTSELHSLATAGGGYFYNALSPSGLDSAYANLANLLVDRKIDTTFATKPIQVLPDTVRAPVDVVLSIDLSASMETIESNGLTRIQMVRSAALGFLDSLKPQDRVAIVGWTSSSGNGDVFLSDTGNPSVYYQKWCPFTSSIKAARSFFSDSLNPNEALYGYTPLRISSVVAMKYLSFFSRAEATKVVITLSDGDNNDGEPLSTAVTFLDSLRRTQGLQFHTIGFMDGDTSELHALAMAGGGNFYNAQNNNDLQNAYASLAHQIIQQKLAARKLMIQEVVLHPPLNYIEGSQKSTNSSTVPLQSFENLTDAVGNTVLRWYYVNIPVWGVAEVSYSVLATSGLAVAIGVDSAGAKGGFWSQMVYTDDQLTIQTINLLPTGKGPPVAVGRGRNALSAPSISFRKEGAVRVCVPGVHSPVSLTLFTMLGRIAFCDNAVPAGPENGVLFTIPHTVAGGAYAVRLRWGNTMQWKTIRLIR
jgi:Mg-chelatase subunit ChlD